MSILKKYLESPTQFSKIAVVDFFKNTFAKGFTKKLQGTDFNKDSTSRYSRTKFDKYDPTK